MSAATPGESGAASPEGLAEARELETLRSTVATLRQLLEVQQRAALEYHSRLEATLAERQKLLNEAKAEIELRRRSESSLRFLAEAGEHLASSLDYEVTLSEVARLAVPRLADWCAVDLLAADGRLQRVAIAHPDPAKVELARDLQVRYPADPDAPYGVYHVLRTRQPELVEEVPEALIDTAARDAEHRRILKALNLRSYMVVPLIARGEVLGAITFVASESNRRFGSDDLGLARELARRSALAIENSRLVKETLESREQLETQATELELQQVELEQAREEMMVANEELQQTNDELFSRTEELERTSAIAHDANRAKAEFLAMMSHELRTPLNAIGGYAQLLSLGVHGPISEAQREALTRIERSQAHLLRIINDILNFAKLEAGHVEFEMEEVSLDGLLSTAESLVSPQLRAKHLKFEYRHGDPSVHVRVDRERVMQVLLNLLSNAGKFTDEGGTITLDWRAADRVVHIRVRDTGHGIPREKQSVIFDPFVQASRGIPGSGSGVGLGLAISRDIARAMDGDLTVESEPGKGSTFTLTLPRLEAT